MSSSGGEADRWNERYGSTAYFYGTAPNDFVVENAGRIRSGSEVLFLAEGEGRNAVRIAGDGSPGLRSGVEAGWHVDP